MLWGLALCQVELHYSLLYLLSDICARVLPSYSPPIVRLWFVFTCMEHICCVALCVYQNREIALNPRGV